MANDSAIYRSVMLGDFQAITEKNDTALHIAVMFGNLDTARTILRCHSKLLWKQNNDGDTPLHLAAKYGHHSLVSKFLKKVCNKPNVSGDIKKESKSGDVEKGSKSGDIEKGSESGDVEKGSISGDIEKGSISSSLARVHLARAHLARMKNNNGNIALYEALKSHHESVAKLLLQADNFLPQDEEFIYGRSLYMAVLGGFKDIVSFLLDKIDPKRLNICVNQDWKTVLHAAAIGDHPVIMKQLLDFIKFHNLTLLDGMDTFRSTALHYAAAYSSTVETTVALLQPDPSLAHVGDCSGRTPLVVAIIHRKRKVVTKILSQCPSCIIVRDNCGRNVLHFAVSDDPIMKLLLDRPESNNLVNEVDEAGNTPLHIAIKLERYNSAERLMRVPGIHLGIANNNNETARDLCERSKTSSYRKRRIWKTLLRNKNGINYVADSPPVTATMTHQPADLQRFAETLSVVATLLATVSCAATLAVPGGYKQSGAEEGLAVLAKNAAFKIFLVADAVTMCTSLSAAFTLTWVMLGDHDLMREALPLCNKLLYISLAGICLSFSAGTFVVVSGMDLCLAIITFIVGCVALVVPLYFLIKQFHHKDSLIPMEEPAKNKDEGREESLDSMKNPTAATPVKDAQGTSDPVKKDPAAETQSKTSSVQPETFDSDRA